MAEETRQTRTVSVRVTRAEYQALTNEAIEADLTISTLIRRALMPVLTELVNRDEARND
jgi:hypothetical protein